MEQPWPTVSSGFTCSRLVEWTPWGPWFQVSHCIACEGRQSIVRVLHALLQSTWRKESSNSRWMAVVLDALVEVECLHDWEAFNLRPQSCIADYNSTTESVLILNCMTTSHCKEAFTHTMKLCTSHSSTCMRSWLCNIYGRVRNLFLHVDESTWQ